MIKHKNTIIWQDPQDREFYHIGVTWRLESEFFCYDDKDWVTQHICAVHIDHLEELGINPEKFYLINEKPIRIDFVARVGE